MKILITNDDGIDAKGIRLLAKWAKNLGEVTVVAPKVEQSGRSQAIDFVQPIEIVEVPFMEGVKAYRMSSTPADCVRFGVVGLKQKYDLVLSGINYGVNLGADIVYSGTVGAIFEAARMKMPAIAFSSFPDEQEAAAERLTEAYDYIMKNNLFAECLPLNVNIPKNAKAIRMTYQGSPFFSDEFEKLDKENMYMQMGEPIPDVEPNNLDRDTVAVRNGFISITPLTVFRTDMEVFRKYQTKD